MPSLATQGWLVQFKNHYQNGDRDVQQLAKNKQPSTPATFPIALNDSSHHRKDMGSSVHKMVVYKRDQHQVESKLFNNGYLPVERWMPQRTQRTSSRVKSQSRGIKPIHRPKRYAGDRAFSTILEKLADLESDGPKLAFFRRLDLRGSIDAYGPRAYLNPSMRRN